MTTVSEMNMDRINFNAQHSPMGAFMSFTCGHFGSGGGIGLEIGKPASQSIYIGVKHGPRESAQPIRCLPFIRRNPVAPQESGAAGAVGTPAVANYSVEHVPPSTVSSSIELYQADQIHRHYGWATDTWETDDFTFSIYTPFGSIPEPGSDPDRLRLAVMPAVVATLTVDNRDGKQTRTGVFAIDFVEPGTRLITGGEAHPTKRGFAWRRSMGVLGMLDAGDDLYPFQRWSVAEGVADVNPVHELGTCGGLAFEVPPGESRTLVLAIGVYLDGIVTTGLEGKYFYTRIYSSLDEVLATALDRSTELRARAQRVDTRLLASGLSSDQQFLIAHGTRSYYGSTQLLDIGGEPFWVVNEGEYCMMNTLDLAIDHAFWELEHNPWVVRNILTNFVRHYSYRDQLKSRGASQLLPGGISFTHDMGANNNFSRAGNSSYELPHLSGCFSFMTQEQLCNWVLMAACYVLATGDTAWLVENAHVLAACAESMRARANPHTGVMAYDSARCAGGKEITTYDSLDESLGQARNNTYLATKCWATWLGLEVLSSLHSVTTGDGEWETGQSLADRIAEFLTASIRPDGTLPAVLEKDNPGYQSSILPVIEALIYPTFWLRFLNERAGNDALESRLRGALDVPFVEMLRQHALKLLTDPQRRNLFADGGIRLSSTASNSWMSKIAMVQHVARDVLRLHETDPRVTDIFRAADAAHVRWQIDGGGYWACSDQFVNGQARGSRYYPRIITAALWLGESPDETVKRAPLEAKASS